MKRQSQDGTGVCGPWKGHRGGAAHTAAEKHPLQSARETLTAGHTYILTLTQSKKKKNSLCASVCALHTHTGVPRRLHTRVPCVLPSQKRTGAGRPPSPVSVVTAFVRWSLRAPGSSHYFGGRLWQALAAKNLSMEWVGAAGGREWSPRPPRAHARWQQPCQRCLRNNSFK